MPYQIPVRWNPDIPSERFTLHVLGRKYMILTDNEMKCPGYVLIYTHAIWVSLVYFEKFDTSRKSAPAFFVLLHWIPQWAAWKIFHFLLCYSSTWTGLCKDLFLEKPVAFRSRIVLRKVLSNMLSLLKWTASVSGGTVVMTSSRSTQLPNYKSCLSVLSANLLSVCWSRSV